MNENELMELPSNPDTKKNDKVPEKTEELTIPKFLLKFSSTYFKRASQVQAANNKDKVKKKKKTN